MSLATRCAACGTVFRVVQDQLKVSEGWVRCGKCNEVFNALDGLFDLQRETPPGWSPSQRGAGELQPVGADKDPAERSIAPAQDEMLFAADAADSPPDTAQDTRIDSQVDTRQASHEGDDDEWAPPMSSDDPADGAPEPQAEAGAAPPLDPAFLRQANRAARWQSTPVRLALMAAATGLGLLLAAQLAVDHRDALAARWPVSAPLLTTLCETTACRIEPVRRLEGWAVESSSLSKVDNTTLYRLQVALRNRDTLALMVPALDVTLTDNRGEVVARKVLAGKDFGEASLQQLAGGADLSLQSVLDAGERSITGYSIEIFYP